MCPQTLQKTGSPIGGSAAQPCDSSGGDSPAVGPEPLPRIASPVHPCPGPPAAECLDLSYHPGRRQGQTLFGPSIYLPGWSQECGVL